MLTSRAHRRLLCDFKKLTADAPSGVAAAPIGDDMFSWCGIVFGPASTPWEGGVWKLDMKFPADYPEKPPVVRFRGEVFHPNVFPDGQTSLELLRGSGWTPALDVAAILVAVQGLMAEPATQASPESCANPEAENMFLRDRQQYDAKVKALVDKQIDEDDANMGCLSAVP
mmetsp:Transcript_45204/g.127353  ORF Transcript_45204/g.127353 Transcript_45204/m.127353 type:complete len:170 (+) Transcript_45204:85-594(+)